MAKKKTVVTEVASALGAAAARVENLKPKRALTPKHSKAKALPTQAQLLTEQEEISLVAYLYAEARASKALRRKKTGYAQNRKFVSAAVSIF